MKTMFLVGVSAVLLAAGSGAAWVKRPALPGDQFQLAEGDGPRTRASEGNGTFTRIAEGNGPRTSAA